MTTFPDSVDVDALDDMCDVVGCAEEQLKHGLCHEHYWQQVLDEGGDAG